jgi:uncharacterized protein YbjT (DUF2867 family)
MVLVIGATSQVGVVLLDKLLGQGYKVRCLVRKCSNIDRINHKNIELAYGDANDKNSLIKALDGVDYVVHIAGIWRAQTLLDACSGITAIKKLIFIGSTSRFKKLDSIDDEEKLLALKMSGAEHAIMKSGLNTVILRPTMIYGIDRDKNILQIINFMKKFSFYPVMGTGCALKHPVYVGDVAAAICSCITKDNVTGKDYVIAGKSPVAYKNMLKLIKDSMNQNILLIPIPTFLGYIAVFMYKLVKPKTYINYAMIKRIGEDMTYDIFSAVNDFGYNPIGFDDGIKKQVGYLREKGVLK